MKLKMFSFITLFVGVAAAVVGLWLPVVVADSSGAAGGIIGGADIHIYTVLIFSFLLHGLPFFLVLLGVTLVVTALFCFLFRKIVVKHCHRGTSLIALSLSAVGGAGLVCALEWFAVASLSSAKEHPIAYPLSVAGGFTALFVFLAMIALYFRQRSKHWSIWGTIIDVLTSIWYLPSFFWGFLCLLDVIH